MKRSACVVNRHGNGSRDAHRSLPCRCARRSPPRPVSNGGSRSRPANGMVRPCWRGTVTYGRIGIPVPQRVAEAVSRERGEDLGDVEHGRGRTDATRLSDEFVVRVATRPGAADLLRESRLVGLLPPEAGFPPLSTRVSGKGMSGYCPDGWPGKASRRCGRHWMTPPGPRRRADVGTSTQRAPSRRSRCGAVRPLPLALLSAGPGGSGAALDRLVSALDAAGGPDVLVGYSIMLEMWVLANELAADDTDEADRDNATAMLTAFAEGQAGDTGIGSAPCRRRSGSPASAEPFSPSQGRGRFSGERNR